MDCEVKIDSCLNNQCQNGARCIPRFGGYSCSCRPGFTGQLCDVNIDECSPNTCSHGTCIDGVNDYTCQCDPGYTGRHCTINIDECQSRLVQACWGIHAVYWCSVHYSAAQCITARSTVGASVGNTCGLVEFGKLQRIAVQYGIVRHSTAMHSIVQYSTAQHGLKHSIVRHSAA